VATLYEHELMRWLDGQAIGYAISADMSVQHLRIGFAEVVASLGLS
jgi:hypothetical protein